MRVRDAVEGFTRLCGAYVILAGIGQVAIGVLVIWVGGSLKLDSITNLGIYLIVFNLGFIIIGPMLLALSGPLARFAAKHVRDES